MDRSEKGDGGSNPADDLTDELIVEILSRLPFKSVCRFKCVSKHWLHGLITSHAHRAKLPQTLTGFFRRIDNDPSDVEEYGDGDERDIPLPPGLINAIIDPAHRAELLQTPGIENHGPSDGDDDDVDSYNSSDYVTSVPDFVSIVGEEGHQVVSPSLSFLPGDIYRSISPEHCSNGLVVCLCWKDFRTNEADYVVCNPATEEWVALPDYGHGERSYNKPLHLAVDPASASGHFHLFALHHHDHGHIAEIDTHLFALHHDYRYITGVDIYSSETREWSHQESGWAYGTTVHHHSVFLHGMLHFATPGRAIVAVDTQGSTWKAIHLLDAMEPVYVSSSSVPFIGESQGRLHYVNSRSRDYYALAVWTLEDDDQWIYKYNISTPRLFAAKLMDKLQYSLVAIHPERNIIFFISRSSNTFMSYDFDLGIFDVVRTLNCFSDGSAYNPYLPYVPSSRSIAS